MAVTPANASTPLGTTEQYKATGSYSDGSTADLTASATWTSAVQNVASISTAGGTKGLATTAATGSTTISASSGSISGSTALTVTAAVLSSIDVAPATPSTSVGKILQFTATGHYGDGTTQPITASVTWSSSLPAIATISNASGTQGQTTGVANGTTAITASLSGVHSSTNLKVADTPCVGSPCVLTVHANLSRDGVISNETTLNPNNVTNATFGRVGSVTGLTGQIYTQPLYVSGMNSATPQGNLVYVATEQSWVYAINADSPYQIVWSGSYIPQGESPLVTGPGLDLECTNITPTVGITGTPVIDPNTKVNANPVMYFVTKSVDGNKTYHHRLHAVDIVTGSEVLGGPVEVQTPASSTVPFDARYQNQRSGLALTYDANGNPQIYVEWGAHCTEVDWHGWMMKYTVSGGALSTTPAAYFLTSQAANGAGLWMSGGAPAIDNPINGNLFVATGQGPWDGSLNWGESILKLDSNLNLADWYTPNEWHCLNGIPAFPVDCSGDMDLGSGGVVLFNVPGGVPELVAAGKRGEIYVNYQSNLGHLDPMPTPSDYSYRTCTTGLPYPAGGQNDIAQCFPGIQNIQGSGPGGSRGTPVFWNDTLYTSGSGDAIRAFPLGLQLGTFDTTGATNTDQPFLRYPGGALTVSWDGVDSATGVLWSLQVPGYTNTPPWSAILRAYTPIPTGASLNLLYQSTVGPGAIKFQVPTIANGKVFVGGQGVTGNEGQLFVYGLCPCN